MDKRKHLRKSIILSGQVGYHDVHVPCVIMNISLGGCMVHMDSYVRLPDVVQVYLRDFKLDAEVVDQDNEVVRLHFVVPENILRRSMPEIFSD